MMFIQFLAAVALVATASASQVSLVNQLLNLEATTETQKVSAEHSEAASSTDFPSFKGIKDFPHTAATEAQTQTFPEAFKNFPLFEVAMKNKKTTNVVNPFLVAKEEKSKRQNNLPAATKLFTKEIPFVTHHSKNEPSGIPAAFLEKKVEPNLSESGIPAVFLQKKPEPKLSESGIPLAFLEMKPQSNFDKVSLAQPKCKIAAFAEVKKQSCF